jgi:hypothetical protein
MMTSGRRDGAPVRVLTTSGVEFLQGLTPEEASTVGGHWNAIRRYLDYGDASALPPFEGARVGGRLLETDLAIVELRAILGDVTFESIYEDLV